MHAYTYLGNGKAALTEKEIPRITHERDAIVRVTMSSICTSDLHILHGSVPRALPGVTLGHEGVGVVEEVGKAVTNVRPGDRVAINVETYCGECFFCRHGFVNNCTDARGGWALGCRIDGLQAEYVRVPFADTGLTRLPDNVTDKMALLAGDLLSTGYWAADISEITEDDTVLIIGAGPTGICTLECVLLKRPAHVIVSEADTSRAAFVRKFFPSVEVVSPEKLKRHIKCTCARGGADRVIEVAGTSETFATAWKCARPNGIVTIVAMYDKAQSLPLPDMYGKNLIFKTGGVDGCHVQDIISLISERKLDTTPLVTHTFTLKDIANAYELFAERRDGVIKTAIVNK